MYCESALHLWVPLSEPRFNRALCIVNGLKSMTFKKKYDVLIEHYVL